MVNWFSMHEPTISVLDGFLLAAFKFAGCVLLVTFVLGVAGTVAAKTVALVWRVYLDARNLREAFGLYMANKDVCDTIVLNIAKNQAAPEEEVVA